VLLTSPFHCTCTIFARSMVDVNCQTTEPPWPSTPPRGSRWRERPLHWGGSTTQK
jgi:hypothetical protein